MIPGPALPFAEGHPQGGPAAELAQVENEINIVAEGLGPVPDGHGWQEKIEHARRWDKLHVLRVRQAELMRVISEGEHERR